nr:hypothetical protein [Tanacetum cinerariifolium]
MPGSRKYASFVPKPPHFSIFQEVRRTSGKLKEHMITRPDHQDPNAQDNMKPWKRMGCDGEIDDMLRIRLREAGSDEEIFTSVDWIRAFNINEPIYAELCHEFYSTYEFDEIARKCRVLTEDVVKSLSALIYCRDLDTTTLRDLIDSDGKLILEDPQPGVPRVGIPRPPRASMQDLYDKMGRMEIRQVAIKLMEFQILGFLEIDLAFFQFEFRSSFLGVCEGLLVVSLMRTFCMNNKYHEDENEEKEEEEEEEHLAPVDSAVVIPTDELVSSPEGTEPVIPPPSTDTATTGARITVRLQAAISFPLEAEVERLLVMPTPSPSLLTSLSPPSVRERLAKCTAPVALPSPPLPSPVHMPPPIDCRDDIPETEMPPRKRLCLPTLGSMYEVEESSTARPTGGRGIDYGFVNTLDAEARRRGIGEVGYGIRDTWIDLAEIAPMTVGEVNTRVTELAELHEHDTQDLYALLEDAQDRRTRISQRVDVDSQRVDLLKEDMIAHQETIQIVEEEAYDVYAHEFQLQSTLIQTQHQLHETRFQMQQTKIAELRETNHRRQAQMAETLRVMGNIRREMGDMHA